MQVLVLRAHVLHDPNKQTTKEAKKVTKGSLLACTSAYLWSNQQLRSFDQLQPVERRKTVINEQTV
jgi:hypothetical protein